MRTDIAINYDTGELTLKKIYHSSPLISLGWKKKKMITMSMANVHLDTV